MIKLQVIGHLGKDCITNTVNGKNVINFSVAPSEKFRDATGNVQERTTWVECAYWTERTAIAPYLKKGTQVYVEGNPEVRTYPKKDGGTGASLTLRVFSVQLLGGGRSEGSSPVQDNNQYQGQPHSPVAEGEEDNDDLPF